MKDKCFKCLFCGGVLSWESDANANELSCEYAEDDTAAVSYYTCQKCGRSYEIIEPTEDERNKYYKDYWINK